MAKQQKDITDLFRDNAHKLNQKPSEVSWERIQQRLADSPTQVSGGSGNKFVTKRPFARRRWLSGGPAPMNIAAALALVLGLSVVFMWLVDKQDRAYQRAVAEARPALQVEELDLTTSQETTLLLDVAVAQQQIKPRKPINEGKPEQKLIAKAVSDRMPIPAHRQSLNDSMQDEHRIGR